MTSYDDVELPFNDLPLDERIAWQNAQLVHLGSLSTRQREYLLGYIVAGLSHSETGREEWDDALNAALQGD